ncbi:orotidine-5'-phosphate decarboxylase [Apibacter adventoris]|uniref:Orotate phosphoribosyltransferase n=1 Tax=Apibacter adventoris TaxID=1679466 RepID=A0A2S8ACU3_9FLAO|nr:orotidine-5'-phosphate decarboxylase [Apibacter adventoris]PQL92677.1 orotidine 5'-phosphate decarboxylase [Apibacter adventoris]
MISKEEFLLKAYKLGIIKFGNFTLKSGIQSPFYVDLRPIASDPELLKELSQQLLNLLKKSCYDLICGVPYAALPMATAMSLDSGTPLIIKRKESKGYGTKKMLEGIFKSGQTCVLVEDVITSGKSLIETIEEVEKEGLRIKDIVVVLDREQGGVSLLKEKGYNVYNLFTIEEVVDLLYKNNLLSQEELQNIKNFLKSTPIVTAQVKSSRLTYEEKAALQSHPAAKKILEIAIKKKSNLIASLDVSTTQEVLQLAETIGDTIVAVKLHTDIIKDFSEEYVIKLKSIANKKNFLLFEDRKFGDIGNTQQMQFEGGLYKISDWADLITSHVIAGEDSLKIFDSKVGIITIAEMSSSATLTDENYKKRAIEISENISNVIGCVAQSKLPSSLLLFTPGVNLNSIKDKKGQNFNTPEKVFDKNHTDFIIVGRGIYKSTDPKKEALKYQKSGWEAYLKNISI